MSEIFVSVSFSLSFVSVSLAIDFNIKCPCNALAGTRILHTTMQETWQLSFLSDVLVMDHTLLQHHSIYHGLLHWNFLSISKERWTITFVFFINYFIDKPGVIIIAALNAIMRRCYLKVLALRMPDALQGIHDRVLKWLLWSRERFETL